MVSNHLINGGHLSEINCINGNDVISAFPRLFTWQGKVIGHMMKIEFQPGDKDYSTKGIANPASITRIGPKKDRSVIEKETY